MKKYVFVLVIVIAAFVALSCSDSTSDCENFCERMQTCDETGVWSDDQTTRCKEACTDADEETELDVERHSCVQFEDCIQFMSCTAAGGPDHMSGDESDGDAETEAEGV